jgi:hypothetical protein
LLEDGARERPVLLRELGIGLRTFYRETELLRRVGIRVRLEGRRYVMHTRFAQAEARLPFPDPRLTFAEMRLLASTDGEVGLRMAALYTEVIAAASTPPPRSPAGRGRRRSSSK